MVAHGRHHALALRLPFEPPLFVAHTPGYDRRMVAVAAYHTLKLPDVLGIGSHKTVFLHHKNTKAIASIKHGGSHGIVARTIGIHTHVLQPAQAMGLKSIGDRSPHSGVVLMHVDTTQRQTLSVEDEPAVGVEAHSAETYARVGFIKHTSIRAKELRGEGVEIRTIGAPQLRGVDIYRSEGRIFLPYGNSCAGALGCGHKRAGGIAQCSAQACVCHVFPGCVPHLGLHFKACVAKIAFVHYGMCGQPEWLEMHRRRFHKPYMAVYAAPS